VGSGAELRLWIVTWGIGRRLLCDGRGLRGDLHRRGRGRFQTDLKDGRHGDVGHLAEGLAGGAGAVGLDGEELGGGAEAGGLAGRAAAEGGSGDDAGGAGTAGGLDDLLGDHGLTSRGAVETEEEGDGLADGADEAGDEGEGEVAVTIVEDLADDGGEGSDAEEEYSEEGDDELGG